jgi:hypothetical protein
MPVKKQRVTVTVDPHLLEVAIRAAETGEAESVSGWVTTAMSEKAWRHEKIALLRAAVDDCEAEFGEITPTEIAVPTREGTVGRASAFRSVEQRAAYCRIYDEALAVSGVAIEECDVGTSFGATHVLRAGDPATPPLVALPKVVLTQATEHRTPWLRKNQRRDRRF